MKLNVLLADRGAQNPHNGTLSLLNVGWSVTQLRRVMGPGMPPDAPPLVTGPQVVVVFIEAELAMCNRALTLQIELRTEDGDVVDIAGPSGHQPVRLEQTIMVPSPAGVPTGFPGRATAMMELPTGLPLAPGIYRWQSAGQRRRGRRMVGAVLRGRAAPAPDLRVLATLRGSQP